MIKNIGIESIEHPHYRLNFHLDKTTIKSIALLTQFSLKSAMTFTIIQPTQVIQMIFGFERLEHPKDGSNFRENKFSIQSIIPLTQFALTSAMIIRPIPLTRVTQIISRIIGIIGNPHDILNFNENKSNHSSHSVLSKKCNGDQTDSIDLSRTDDIQ